MKKLLILVLPFALYAQDLKSLINLAYENNNLVKSSTLTVKSKSKNVDSKESAYYPTLDVGGYYQNLEKKSPFTAGETYSGYAKVGVDIYDGGQKSALVSQAKHERRASTFESQELKKSLSLQIVQDYYTIKSLNASLVAKEDADKSLQEQLERMKQFYKAQLATKDDVDRLQAAYDTNVYEIDSLKFNILSSKKALELKVGRDIDSLEDSEFKEVDTQEFELVDSIKSLTAQKRAVLSASESLDSIYYPKLRVEDTYSYYGYGKTLDTDPQGLDKQNKLMVTLNMRLFDFFSAKDAKQSLRISSQALNEQVAYKTKEQKVQYELAKSRINISKIKIKSAKSALIAAKSAFKTVNEKYNAGIVDYVIYLDALTAKTNANALYEKSLNDLQVAYAMYYYYSGKDLKEFIK